MINKSFVVITQHSNGELEVSVDSEMNICELGQDVDATVVVANALKLIACDPNFPNVLEKLIGSVSKEGVGQ